MSTVLRRWKTVHRLALSVLACLMASSIPRINLAQNTEKQPQPSQVLRIDPLLLAEASEVWSLIASADNLVWPGWNASDTPLLFYLPNEQDVLVNHPRPPSGFLPYDGLPQFPGWRIYVKNGPTLITQDGQNTAFDVAGVPTLAVADTLSNLRNRVVFLVMDSTPTAEKLQHLKAENLSTNPYDQLALVTHEAFHVFQEKQAPDKGVDEMLLAHYPVLSTQNNVGFALEGSALASALTATNRDGFRRAAVRWLAVRKDRRSKLSPQAVEYEDGAEFTEGLATYTQYRLFEVLQGHQPSPPMNWAQGFSGYADLAAQRHKLVQELLDQMNGTTIVNADPYGTAGLRMRLYYSGMAEGVLLDQLLPDWKSRIFSAQISLTSLAEEALKPSPAELERALAEAKTDSAYSSLVAEKTKLEKDGQAHAEALVKEIETGPGIRLIINYSRLDTPKLGMAFTPFGITAVDANRTIFSQVPIALQFGPAGTANQTVATPLLRDTTKHLVEFRLPANSTRSEIEKTLTSQGIGILPFTNLDLQLPGANIKAAKAQIHWSANDLTIDILNPDTK
jgi:hypothetical protein